MGKQTKKQAKGTVKMFGANIRLVETGRFLQGELKRKPRPTEKETTHGK
jgi:hypothetical protein